MRITTLGFLAAAFCAPLGTQAALWLPTNVGIGADAEVRESNPTQNRGTSTEIASRVKNDVPLGNANDGSDRNSAIYTKFDIFGQAMPDDGHTAFRMSYRNNNLNESRIQDSITPNPAIRTGLAIYGLNNAALENWDENTITYLTAPGITFDGDVGTKDFNSDLTFLGTVAFPEIGTQNWLPVGDFLEFRSAALDSFLANAIANSQKSVTLVSTVIHGGDARSQTGSTSTTCSTPRIRSRSTTIRTMTRTRTTQTTPSAAHGPAPTTAQVPSRPRSCWPPSRPAPPSSA
ncbi:MAG: hypothetical protein R3C45_04465 [Phycisphaerales bacterium]